MKVTGLVRTLAMLAATAWLVTELTTETLHAGTEKVPAQPDPPRVRQLAAPMVFEPNVGQATRDVAFVGRGQGYVLEIARTNLRIGLRPDPQSTPAALSMMLVDAATHPLIKAVHPGPGRSNYLVGDDRAHDLTDVPHFGRVEVSEVYPGIDLAYYGKQQTLEYDFIVQPGADPGRIRLAFSGYQSIALSTEGELVFGWGGRELRQPRPVIYQLPGHEPVDGRFVLGDAGTVSFDVPSWDRTKTLVIDPTIVFGTYLGGATNAEQVGGVAVDLDGNIYVTGFTTSTDFPTVGPYQPTHGGGQVDTFVTKMNATGTAILYSTYLGGNSFEWAYGVAVDAAGSAYVVGSTLSTNFPRVGPLTSCTSSGGFVSKLVPAGNALSFSYCIPGTLDARAVAVDGSGSAYVTGWTTSGLPVVNAAQPTSGGFDAFVGKLNATGSAWNYLTYLGGSQFDEGYGIGVNSAGQACVTGRTSGGFPVLNARQPTAGGSTDAFVTKYDAAGAVVYSTYLGGSALDIGQGAAADAAGTCYVTGYTFSANFPTVAAAQPTYGGRRDAFVTAYNPTGSAYVYSTFIGGALGLESGLDIAVTAAGVAHIVGETGSRDFPVVSPLQTELHDVGGVRTSTNSGASFTPGLQDVGVQAVAVDPTNAQVQYAGTADGIYRTTNGGATWARVDSGLQYTDVRALAIDPNAHCTVYAGIETFVTNIVTPTFIQVVNTNGVLVRSLDCGATWGIPAGAPSGQSVQSLAFGAGNPAALHMSLAVNGVVSGSISVTFARVVRWTPTVADYSFLLDDFSWIVAADGVGPCTSFAGGQSGQVRINSSCGTPSFSAYGASLGSPIRTLAAHPSSAGTLLAGTTNGRIYRKPDIVSPWALAATLGGAVSSIVFQPGNPQVAYAASEGVVYRSVNGGVSWAAITTIGPTISSLSASSTLLAAGVLAASDVFYAKLSAAGGILDSTWFGGFTSDRGEGVALHPSGDVILAGTTGAQGFPTTPGVIAPNRLGFAEAFVVRLGSTASCTYAINPTSAIAPPLGGPGTVTVTTSLGCPWTATSNAGFITVTAGSSGFTSGTVSYSLTANGGPSARQGTLTIAGQTFTVTQAVAPVPTITLSPATLSNGTVGVAYAGTTITQTGGTPPATFAVTSGALPSGLSLSSGGLLGGTPTAAGTFTFTVTATDASGFTGSRTYTVSITGPTVLRGDLVVDFGSSFGLWLGANQTSPAAQWTQLHPLSPSVMATGDVDGNGRSDAVVTFPGFGVWTWLNNSSWVQLHPLDALEITTGDLDGNGLDEVALSFATYGLWIRYNNTSWVQLHPLGSAGMVSGNLDGDSGGRAELVVNFAGHGVFLYMNNTTWTQLHPLNATDLRTADLDGNGQKDVVLSFAGYGVWIRYNNASWFQLHPLNSAGITVGNLDGDAGRNDDLVVSFPGYGLWTWKNRSAWTQLHPLNATVMGATDVDGGGRADVVVSFPGYGLWVWRNDTSFLQLHPINPDGFVTGLVDSN